MNQSVKFVGLDVHKDTIAVAVAEGDSRSEVRELGEIANTPAALTKLLGKLGGTGIELHVCCEAGPCGYGIQRQTLDFMLSLTLTSGAYLIIILFIINIMPCWHVICSGPIAEVFSVLELDVTAGDGP